MSANPLTAPILALLRLYPEGISEHGLIEQLAFDETLLGDAHSVDLRLFRKHFLVMNALYRLQPILWEEGVYLSISALKIELQSLSKGAVEQLPVNAAEQALREYYLDWQEFERSSDAQVQQLLDSFWQRYFAEDGKQQALQVLGLGAGCDWPQIRHAYRSLVAQHHPDRGGDTERFRQVREAYECLACCYT